MTPELPRRIAFTLGALLVYRLGSYIPLPGVARSSGQLSIFSLGILPYLTAAIILQLVSMVSSKLSTRARSGEAGRRRITRYTLGLTLFLTGFQAFGIASKLQEMPDVVSDSGGFFLLSATVTLTGGAVFLIWLSEQITARGIGNGLVLMLFAGVVTGLPETFASIAVLAQQGALSGNQIALRAILWVAVIGLVVFVERARRR